MTAAAVDSRDGPGRLRIGPMPRQFRTTTTTTPNRYRKNHHEDRNRLPSHIAGVPGPLNTTWARHAEQRGFDCVAAIGRLVYPSLNALVALALAAGATESIGLVTNILLAPLHRAAVLAKQLATMADSAPSRLTLGIAVGARQNDYTTAGADFGTRGRALDRAMKVMRTTWRGARAPRTPSRALCP